MCLSPSAAMFYKPASELALDEIGALFIESFSGYVGGPVSQDTGAAGHWADANYVSPPRSYVFFASAEEDGVEGDPAQPVALALICLRDDKPGEARLGIMGVVPRARGKGVGGKALRMVIEGERRRGLRLLELEVLQKNAHAVQLYRRAGFAVARELLGWRRGPTAAADFPPDAELRGCDVGEVEAAARAHMAADLPWQTWHFANERGAKQGFRLGGALCVVSQPQEDEKEREEGKDEAPMNMFSLVVEPEHRGRGAARRLVRAVMGRFPGRSWSVSDIFPKEYGDKIATELGFGERETKQFQMKLQIDP